MAALDLRIRVPRDTIATGDSLLWLASRLPLGLRVDAYAQADSGGRARTDFQTPYVIKLLSSGVLSRGLSGTWPRLRRRCSMCGWENRATSGDIRQ